MVEARLLVPASSFDRPLVYLSVGVLRNDNDNLRPKTETLMPLTHYSLETIGQVLDRLDTLDREADRLPGRRRMLAFSCPDVIVDPTNLVQNVLPGRLKGKKLALDPRSDQILNWHNARWVTQEVVDTVDLFDALNCDLTSLDIVRGRGSEVIQDMNEPLPRVHHQQYDIVFDCISNQVFNVAEVMRSAALAVKVGGCVLHVTPAASPNQGFWSVSPTAYHDFYELNDFEVTERYAVVDFYQRKLTVELRQDWRERGIPDDTVNVVLATKLKHREPHRIQWPIMNKFRKNPNCLKVS